MSNTFLLYGANGYTGQLICKMLDDYGLKPILSGRRKEALEPMATALHTSYRVSGLDDGPALDVALQDVSVVLHAAGPFKRTARPMIEACLRNKKHYIDITGEIEVYEMAKKYDDAAKKAGIMIMLIYCFAISFY